MRLQRYDFPDYVGYEPRDVVDEFRAGRNRLILTASEFVVQTAGHTSVRRMSLVEIKDVACTPGGSSQQHRLLLVCGLTACALLALFAGYTVLVAAIMVVSICFGIAAQVDTPVLIVVWGNEQLGFCSTILNTRRMFTFSAAVRQAWLNVASPTEEQPTVH